MELENAGPDDLGQAIQLLQERPIPAGFGAATEQRLLATLMARSQARRPLFSRPLTRLAIAAVVGIVFGSVAFWATQRHSYIAFGDVIDAMKQFRSLSYSQTQTISLPGVADHTITGTGVVDTAGR